MVGCATVQPGAFTPRNVIGFGVSLTLLTACLTSLFLAMRKLMDIGGACATGGPYEIAQPCPEGVAAVFPVAIILGIASAFAVGVYGGRLGYGTLALLAWPALFLSLGWNFLEYAFDPPGDDGGIVGGWLVCGVIFVLMGGLPLLPLVRHPKEIVRFVWPPEPPPRETPRPAPVPAPTAPPSGIVRDVAQRTRRRPPVAVPAGVSRPAAEPGVVDDLERLADLHRQGALTDREFAQAKEQLLR